MSNTVLGVLVSGTLFLVAYWPHGSHAIRPIGGGPPDPREKVLDAVYARMPSRRTGRPPPDQQTRFARLLEAGIDQAQVLEVFRYRYKADQVPRILADLLKIERAGPQDPLSRLRSPSLAAHLGVLGVWNFGPEEMSLFLQLAEGIAARHDDGEFAALELVLSEALEEPPDWMVRDPLLRRMRRIANGEPLSTEREPSCRRWFINTED